MLSNSTISGSHGSSEDDLLYDDALREYEVPLSCITEYVLSLGYNNAGNNCYQIDDEDHSMVLDALDAEFTTCYTDEVAE